jgi:hypothetical protein
LQKYIAISLLIIISGCGVKSGIHSDLPAITDKGMAGKVVVVRTSNLLGVAVGWEIDIDGKDLFGIGSGEYTEFLLPEGEHSITLRCGQPDPMHSDTLTIVHSDTLKFDIKASQTIYFLVSPSLKCAKMRLSDETEAKKHIKRSKFINLEEYGWTDTQVVPIDANLPKKPLVEALAISVGVYYSPEFSTHQSIEEVVKDRDRYKFNLGSDSVALFDQVFASMFERVIPVENRPPLRTDGPKVDAVIEPRIGYVSIGVAPPSQRADYNCWVRIAYYITLYSPDGGLLALFRVDAVGESRPGYSTGVKSFGEAMHFAMRDAAAQVMAGFGNEPGVREWLEDLGVVASVISPKRSEQ